MQMELVRRTAIKIILDGDVRDPEFLENYEQWKNQKPDGIVRVALNLSLGSFGMRVVKISPGIPGIEEVWLGAIAWHSFQTWLHATDAESGDDNPELN